MLSHAPALVLVKLALMSMAKAPIGTPLEPPVTVYVLVFPLVMVSLLVMLYVGRKVRRPGGWAGAPWLTLGKTARMTASV
jgi:hypothetical protein